MKQLAIFRGKKVFLTGHTGFKGSWLSIWLAELGASVFGYALSPPTDPSNFHASGVDALLAGHMIGDIRDGAKLKEEIRKVQPDVIFHMAAQPIVKAGYVDPVGTFDANIMGTVHLLEAVRTLGKPCVVVVVSSDKCYLNLEQVWGYRECDPLGGHDPYSASKAGTEIVAASYRDSFFAPHNLAKHGVALASARAGNVLGGGDWAASRIMTDVIASLVSQRPLVLRYPQAVRPWQHVLEPLHGYLLLAAQLLDNPSPTLCSAFNFGPHPESTKPVCDLVDIATHLWGSGQWKQEAGVEQPHEASLLRLSVEKAINVLGWAPRWTIEQCMTHTVAWYQDYYGESKSAMLERCRADIAAFSR